MLLNLNQIGQIALAVRELELRGLTSPTSRI
jgi:hypothetical protein